MSSVGKVYVVHCIDTEGPIHESLEATFQRLFELTGVRVSPSNENLEKIRRCEIDLNGLEALASKVFSSRFLDYKENWIEIEAMLDVLTSQTYRMSHKDSNGNGWKYNWFIMDWADFDENPRGRDIGYHNIYDRYASYYREKHIDEDAFFWHAHPMPISKEAHRCATSFLNSPHVFQSLARRLIDRGCFTNCFRAGFDCERPDISWFLEQYIPFDFSNQAVESTTADKMQKDLVGGRFGDWRRAPATWECYHPSHEDYQISGDCNRVIFRCLNIGTRTRELTQKEVDKAFRYAADLGQDVVLAFADHDWRNMIPDVEDVYGMLLNASKQYPDVDWIHTRADEAAKKTLNISTTALQLDVEIIHDENSVDQLRIHSSEDTFGPQPFFAIKMCGGRYVIDNLDFQVPKREWSYTFDANTVYLKDVEKIGVATNSVNGAGALKVIAVDNSVVFQRTW